jgi:DNA-binding Lrp family transcriptional regulator
MEDYAFKSDFNEKQSVMVRRIVRLLSENSRISVTEMARLLGVSRRTVEDRIRKAEQELGIKYTLELDEAALGLDNQHLILIKFTQKPDRKVIKGILESSHIPQLAVALNGNYDMFIYANAEDPNEYVYWDKTTQVLLSDYKALWQPSDLAFRHLGFFPIRMALIEKLKIPELHKRILLLLNENSRMSFIEMSKRLGMRPNTLAYNFKKLMKIGYIKRFTIVMRSQPGIIMIPLFGKYIIAKGFEDDSMRMRREVTFIDDKMPLVSRCLFSAQLVGSFDFFFVGAYDNYKVGYDHLVKYYKRRYKNHKVRIMHGTVDEVLVGDFPIRNLDSKKEFNMIRWIPGVKPQVEKPQ